ncbi:MAG TPA: acyltransferase [Gemmataceae bacterium]|nr:acyltransferase [Gemmataceae bacterium]
MKSLLKIAVNALATLLVLPACALYLVGRLFLGANKAFPGWSQAFSMIPGLTGVYLRRAFYRLVLRRCGNDCCLSFGTVFSHPSAAVGARVFTGAYCVLGDVTLEDDVLLGSQVSIINGGGQHGTARLDVPIREQPGVLRHVTVGQDSWIGERAVVLADVGKHCIVAAGAVVTKPVPDFAIAAGVPARVVKFRTDEHLVEDPPVVADAN